MKTTRCPVCGCVGEIISTEDFLRNLTVFQCASCGDMYATRNEIIWEFGWQGVYRDWKFCAESRKKLNSRSKSEETPVQTRKL